ncbi:DNA photolyase family protein [Paenibacillus sp. TRM 82003]|nr:DNA photolyase family protein [Paenibacillus sp. TRM 82003]
MILFLHRKDLRTDDLRAFDYISARRTTSLHLLILDPAILADGRTEAHSGRSFLRHAALLQAEYERHGRRLAILYGEPTAVLAAVCERHPDVREIVMHEDHTPYAVQRDEAIRRFGVERGLDVTAFAEGSVVSFPHLQEYAGRKEPFKVFTPFYRRWNEWLERAFGPGPSPIGIADLSTAAIGPETAEAYALPFELPPPAAESLEALRRKAEAFLDDRLPAYETSRDQFAAEDGGASGLGRHINAGALSVRCLYEAAGGRPGGEAWRRQLAWRDFYLYQAAYDPLFFRYEHAFDLSPLTDEHLPTWIEARTGIPIVDAAMTELRETGAMPNRLRMVSAMFLTKNLLCPFPAGEAYFRRMLADYDNALNRGGWLWCASLGFDAAPYFRVMNPVSQSERYDPSGAYIRRWLPELRGLSDKAVHQPRPEAIVDLKASRARAIDIYKSILATKKQD